MVIEGNRVHDNDKYGIDPHTGTHHMLILNNTVYDNVLQALYVHLIVTIFLLKEMKYTIMVMEII